MDSDSSGRREGLSVSARLSTGDTLPLEWHQRTNGLESTEAGTKSLLLVSLPNGYSNACRFADITMTDRKGHSARWRITRLPKMRHVIPDSPTVTDRITANGITTTAWAWRFRHQIYFQMRPILPTGSHQWEVLMNDQWPEWEAFDQPHGQNSSQSPPILGRNGVFTSRNEIGPYFGTLANQFPADYRSATRYVRQACTLRQFETYDEQVTFHNLAVKSIPVNPRDYPSKDYTFTIARPLTLTTPSGIDVTLPVQGSDGRLTFHDNINLNLTIRQSAAPSDLPRSPLVRQFGKPITVSILFAPPYHADGWAVAPGDARTYGIWPPENPAIWHIAPKGTAHVSAFLDVPPVLKDFTVIVRQRVELQTIPMTFTVPVSDTPPPDIHG